MADDHVAASPEVDQLFALVASRYGDRLTDAERAEVRKGIEAVVTNARALRAVRLRNSDEPSPVFAPFRADA